jgi:hypothetical protein
LRGLVDGAEGGSGAAFLLAAAAQMGRRLVLNATVVDT